MRLIIGRDFAVTRSSLESCCNLFAVASEQTVELKMADIEQTQQMIPFVTCEISLGWHVGKLVFGVDVFDLAFWVHINSIELPMKSNSVVSGNMSHCRTPSFNDHLDHCFVVLKHIQQSFLMRKLDV